MIRRKFYVALPLILSALVTISAQVMAAPGDEDWSADFHHAGISGRIYCTLSQPDGLIIGGAISGIMATSVNNIARVKFVDGVISEVNSLGAGLSGRVEAVGEHKGDLIAIGAFAEGNAARWDGASWQDMGKGLESNRPKTVVSYQGELFAGSFHCDGDQWNNIFLTDDVVTTLVVHDGLLFVGGAFTAVRGEAVEHVFAWDGSNVLELDVGLAGTVTSSAVGPNGISFSWNEGYNFGQIETWDGQQWLVEPSPSGSVSAFTYQGENLVASISHFYGTSWFGYIVKNISVNSLGSWQNVAGFAASNMVKHGGRLILTHNNSIAANLVSPGIVGFDGEAFSRLFPVNNGIDKGFRKLAAFGPAMLATGSFEVAGGKAALNCGVWSEGTWSSWDSYDHSMPGVATGFGDVAAIGYEVYGMMGYFDVDYSFSALMKLHFENGQAIWRNHFLYDYEQLGHLQAVGDQLYIYGWTDVDVLDPSSGMRTPVGGLDLDRGIYDACDSQSQLAICGSFATNAGVPVSNVLLHVDNTWQSVGSVLPGEPTVIEAMSGDHLAVALRDNGSWFVALFDGADWTVLPGTFDGEVADLAYHHGRLIVAGGFGHVGPVPASGIAIWTGNVWAPIGSGLGFTGWKSVTDLLSNGDRLWVTGNFVSAGGNQSAGLAMWSGDPTLITGAPSGVVQALPTKAGLLDPPFPNPFNPRTEIVFRLTTAGPVRVAIYDVHGRMLKTLATKTFLPGDHRLTWDGVDDFGRAMPSGVYFARLSAGEREESVKMTLLR